MHFTIVTGDNNNKEQHKTETNKPCQQQMVTVIVAVMMRQRIERYSSLLMKAMNDKTQMNKYLKEL